MYTPESSEAIRTRMLKDIARQWGHPEDAADTAAGFDPLINLLAGAYAKEIEKIGYEIQSSRQRILSRLVDFLTPDVLTGPSPAHAIAQARPVKSST